jgi:L-rhamnose mutarotase
MERLCFTLSVVPGREAEFDRRHHEIWPEMTEAMARSGYRNYSLFRRGSLVVGYAECSPDVASAQRVMGDQHVSARWAASMAEVLAANGEVSSLAEVWHLD